jgi:hypothetical protein
MDPATYESAKGARLAVWQTGLEGLDWLQTLVKQGYAIDLGGDGYPWRFTATAEQLVPHIITGPPEARATWQYGPRDILLAG